MTDPRVVLDGLVMVESPRWHDGRLWLADWGAREVLAVDEAGTAERVLGDLGGPPLSIDWLPDGRLMVLSGGERRLLRREPDGSVVTHADLRSLSPHAWNELVVDVAGNAWVNNIGYDFPGGMPTTGIIAVVTPDGITRQVADDVAFPNGMAITPDGRTLIVAESHAERLTAFDIDPAGDLSGRRTWARLEGGYPDGICLDADGAAWYADVPNRRCVRVREGGEVLAVVVLDRGGFACMLGGADGRTLFMLANAWGGSDVADARTGRVLAVEAPSPRAGRP